MIPIAKYRTAEQRESIIWVVSVKDALEQYAYEWPAKERNIILGEIIPQMEKWAGQLMEDIVPKEGRAIINLSRRVRPILIASDFTNTDDKIIVDSDDYYSVAEIALEYCRMASMIKQVNKMTNAKTIKTYLKDNFKCQECSDPENCKIRNLFSKFMIPPLNLDGKCEYLQRETNLDFKTGGKT